MSLSIYELTIPQFIHTLENVSRILDLAVTHAESKKIDPNILLGSRLIADQFPLSKQIQVATDNAKLCVPRMTGIQAPVYSDTETTIDELKTRIQNTITFLKSVKPEDFNGWESRKMTFPWSPGYYLNAQDYVIGYLLPNFYFHVTTAYSILRANGVPLGKSDYLRANWQKE